LNSILTYEVFYIDIVDVKFWDVWNELGSIFYD